MTQAKDGDLASLQEYKRLAEESKRDRYAGKITKAQANAIIQVFVDAYNVYAKAKAAKYRMRFVKMTNAQFWRTGYSIGGMNINATCESKECSSC